MWVFLKSDKNFLLAHHDTLQKLWPTALQSPVQTCLEVGERASTSMVCPRNTWESPTSLSKHTMLQSEKQKNDSSRKEFNKDAYKILEELEEQSIESPPHHRILSRKPRKAVIMLISNNRDPEHCLPLLYFFDQSYYLKGFFHTTHHSFLMNSS